MAGGILDPVRTKDEARERGKKGGLASGKSRREKKLLRERLETLLKIKKDGLAGADAICMALIEKALTGDVRAFEVIRDTMGQKPAEKTETTGELEITWQK